MKTTLILISWAVFLSSFSFGQTFAPFNPNVTKRFYNVSNIADNNYFFYADSMVNAGPENIYFQYHSLQTFTIPINDTCGFWGAGGFSGADTTWLGNRIIYDTTTNHLRFFNDQLDTLAFDFSMVLGDSSVFYQDGQDLYYIKFFQQQPEIVFGVSDTVKTFLILHLDTAYQPITSPLHLQEIKLAKNLGLIKFMDTYHFPMVEKSMSLEGQLNPLMGHYQLSYEDAFPYDVGDTIQYNGKIVIDSYTLCRYNITYTVTNRTETVDSVFLELDEWFDWTQTVVPMYMPICSSNVIHPLSSNLNFKKGIDMVGKPFHWVGEDNFGYFVHVNQENIQPYNGFPCDSTYGYYFDGSAEHFCEGCQCYGPHDVGGGWLNDIEYAANLGLTYVYSWQYGPGWTYNSIKMTYTNINGTECGNYEPIGIEESLQEFILLQPNPTCDYFTINAEADQIHLYNMQGNLIIAQNIKSDQLNISHLPAGIYVVEITIDSHRVRKKIIKQ